MKRLAEIAAGIVLSGMVMTTAYAGQKNAVKSVPTGTGVQPVQKQGSASPYTRSKVERNKRAREKSNQLKSSSAGTLPVKETLSRTSTTGGASPAKSAEKKKTDKPKKKGAKKQGPADAQGKAQVK